MSWPAAIVLIVLITAFAGVMRSRYRAQSGIVTDNKGNERPIERRDEDAQREIGELKDRIKVLERIATDPAQRTAQEIEQLRDGDKSGD